MGIRGLSEVTVIAGKSEVIISYEIVPLNSVMSRIGSMISMNSRAGQQVPRVRRRRTISNKSGEIWSTDRIQID